MYLGSYLIWFPVIGGFTGGAYGGQSALLRAHLLLYSYNGLQRARNEAAREPFLRSVFKRGKK